MSTAPKKKGHGRPPTERSKSTLNLKGCKRELIWLVDYYRAKEGIATASGVTRRAIIEHFEKIKAAEAGGEKPCI